VGDTHFSQTHGTDYLSLPISAETSAPHGQTTLFRTVSHGIHYERSWTVWWDCRPYDPAKALPRGQVWAARMAGPAPFRYPSVSI